MSRIEDIAAKMQDLMEAHPNLTEIALHNAVDSWLVNEKTEGAASLPEFRAALKRAGIQF